MTTKEFDEKTIKQLIIDLKDVDNYKSFKHGSFIYDLGYYQGNLLVNEIDRLNNIIDGFERWLKEDLKNNYRDAGCRHSLIVEILDKIKELKEDK